MSKAGTGSCSGKILSDFLRAAGTLIFARLRFRSASRALSRWASQTRGPFGQRLELDQRDSNSKKRAGGERRVEAAHPPGGYFAPARLIYAGVATKTVSFPHFRSRAWHSESEGVVFVCRYKRKKDAAENVAGDWVEVGVDAYRGGIC